MFLFRSSLDRALPPPDLFRAGNTGIFGRLLVIVCFVVMHCSPVSAADLERLEGFGSNPGRVGMYVYAPENAPDQAPLVVSLHGCRQDAETYAGNGWIDLARRWKFYVLFPEQSRDNNPYACWNWFQQADTSRGQGEAESIRQMIETMLDEYAIDSERIFIEGLSAGGWMASAMLAAYPDIFKGGAVIAGGPAYCASVERHFWDMFGLWNIYVAGVQSQRCMGGRDRSPDEWASLVRDQGYRSYDGHWPILSIWHGSEDSTVDPSNQQELLEQWTALHGIDGEPDRERVLGSDYEAIQLNYFDEQGRVLVQTWLIEGLGHGLPIDGDRAEGCGAAGEHILDADICAVRHIGRFWGLKP